MRLTRFEAGGLHLALSAAAAILVFLPLYFLWYPGVLFEFAGGRELFLLIACVDVTLGPIITTVVYRHGKKGMRFDLAVIAILQVSALGYGVSVLLESRPVFIAFVKDRFELVRANEVAENDLGASSRRPREALSLIGPRLVGVRLPVDPDLKFKLAISALGGMDAQCYPQFHVPYGEVRVLVASVAKPIERLRRLSPDDTGAIDKAVAREGPERDLGYLPLRAGRRDLSVIVSKRTGDVLQYLSQRPWEY